MSRKEKIVSLGQKVGSLAEQFEHIKSQTKDELGNRERYDELERIRLSLLKTVNEISEQTIDLNADIEEEQEDLIGYDLRIEPLDTFLK